MPLEKLRSSSVKSLVDSLELNLTISFASLVVAPSATVVPLLYPSAVIVIVGAILS